METIIIDEIDKRTYINIDRKKVMGNTFYSNGRIEPITNQTFSIFKAFILSSNKRELPMEGKYKVFLDNNTGFKHYFLDGKENYTMLFLNNGESSGIPKKKDKKTINNLLSRKGLSDRVEKLEKKFTIGQRIIHCTCRGLLNALLLVFLANSLIVVSNPYAYKDLGPYPAISYVTGVNKTYTADELIERIMSSKNLEREDQLYLANRDFLEDIMPYVNCSNLAKYEYSFKFNNISINVLPQNDDYIGIYFPFFGSSIINVTTDVISDDQQYNDTVAHEFIHLCQTGLIFNVLTESTAELLSSEYFEDAYATVYNNDTYLVRKLMEMIGPKPILKYVISGDFSEIEKAVMPYLSFGDYLLFRTSLVRPTKGSIFYNKEIVDAKFDTLNSLLDKIYLAKYGKESSEDPVIPYLDEGNLVRYYFNKRKINKENSYRQISYFREEEISLEEACEKDFVTIILKGTETEKPIVISLEDYLNHKYDMDRGITIKKKNKLIKDIYIDDEGKVRVKFFVPFETKKEYLPTIYENLNKNSGIKK